MITIADDNEDILESTQLLLEITGHASESTGLAGDIQDLVRSKKPALHLQDMQMPGLDLARLLNDLRADATTADTPIVLFTAGSPHADQWAELGADGCLRKPFDMAKLEAMIEAAQEGGREGVQRLESSKSKPLPTTPSLETSQAS